MLRRVASWVVIVGAVVGLGGGCIGGPQSDPPGLHTPTDRSIGDAATPADAGAADTSMTGVVGTEDAAAGAPDAGAAAPSAGFDSEAPTPGEVQPLRPLPPVWFLVPPDDAAATPDCCDRDGH